MGHRLIVTWRCSTGITHTAHRIRNSFRRTSEHIGSIGFSKSIKDCKRSLSSKLRKFGLFFFHQTDGGYARWTIRKSEICTDCFLQIVIIEFFKIQCTQKKAVAKKARIFLIRFWSVFLVVMLEYLCIINNFILSIDWYLKYIITRYLMF